MNHNDSSKSSFRVLNNQGSILISMLTLAAVIGVTSISVLAAYSHRQKMAIHALAIQESLALANNLRMTFASRDLCKANIASGFGGNAAALSAANANITLSYPVIGQTQPAIIDTNKTVDHMVIKSLQFSRVMSVDAPNSLLGTLKISSADTTSTPLKEVEIPFYFTTDAAGNITDCFASSYPLWPNTQVTMEDLLCQQNAGANYYYSPTQFTCVNNPVVITSR